MFVQIIILYYDVLLIIRIVFTFCNLNVPIYQSTQGRDPPKKENTTSYIKKYKNDA